MRSINIIDMGELLLDEEEVNHRVSLKSKNTHSKKRQKKEN